MNGIKTVEEACDLKEIEYSPIGDYFSPTGMAGDDIVLFIDRDGRSKQVVETKEGPRKMEWLGF